MTTKLHRSTQHCLLNKKHYWNTSANSSSGRIISSLLCSSLSYASTFPLNPTSAFIRLALLPEFFFFSIDRAAVGDT